MFRETNWLDNIGTCLDLVRRSHGPTEVAIVSGAKDQSYWQQRAQATRADVFRADGRTEILAIAEPRPMGNFLGTVNAWRELRAAAAGLGTPWVGLLSMVFGEGRRLSPFTQLLGNRKAALPTPLRGPESRTYLCAGEMSSLYANLWIEHLRRGGFSGMLVKWGDEAIVPGRVWPERDMSRADVVRFVWVTEPTPELASQKEWVVVERDTGRVADFVARRPIGNLRARLKIDLSQHALAVNLGSLAVSHALLEALIAEFEELLGEPATRLDWDPYVCRALLCSSRAEWDALVETDAASGARGARELTRRIPSFFERTARARERLERAQGRPLEIHAVDFGEALWLDMGLHESLRRFFDDLVADSPRGSVVRALCGLAAVPRDDRGNLVVDSRLPAGVDLSSSIVLDSTVESADSVVCGGVLIGGKHGRVRMPEGGVALFAEVGDLTTRHGAISLGSVGRELTLGPHLRHTTLCLGEKTLDLLCQEETSARDAEFYTHPVEHNPVSFEQAARLVGDLVSAGSYVWPRR